jgi:hypothetical protein
MSKCVYIFLGHSVYVTWISTLVTEKGKALERASLLVFSLAIILSNKRFPLISSYSTLSFIVSSFRPFLIAYRDIH